MRTGRCIPPAAAPLGLVDVVHGLVGVFRGKASLRRFERELQEVFKARHVILFSSGKAALTVVLRVLGTIEPKRREVVIPAYTCYSVPSAVARAGMTVVPVDIELETFDFNVKALEGSVGASTLCVMPDHLFGRPSAMDHLVAFCRRRGIFVVEDAAQGFGGELGGRALGTMGDVGIFSLGRGKGVTCGSGGVVITNSDTIGEGLRRETALLEAPSRLAEVVELVRVALMAIWVRPSLYWLPAGLPFLRLGETHFSTDFPVNRLSGMRAGLLRRWRQNLAKGNEARRTNTRYYLKKLLGLGSTEEAIPFLRLPYLVKDLAEKERVLALSKRFGLGISAMYPGAIDEIPGLKLGMRVGGCAHARHAARRLITLPTHHLVRPKDRERILSILCS